MKVEIPYGNKLIALNVQKKDLIGIFSPIDIDYEPKNNNEIAHSLMNPIGIKEFKNLIYRGNKVIIAVDDNTRITPVQSVLTVLLENIESVGVKRDDITIIVALGTHRPMTEKEMKEKFGPEILEEYNIINHEWDNPSKLKFIGNLPNGVPIWINKHFLDSDVRIGIGNIVPHFTSGWSAGSKILLPGLAGEETVAGMHYYAAKNIPNALGRDDNLARTLMDNFARKVGLHMIINTVLTRNGEIAGVYSGDVVLAHRKGVELSKKIYGIPIPRLADITIVSSYPADLEFWQSMKGLYSANLSTKSRGGILLITPSPEGLSSVHKDWGDMLACNSKELEKMMEKRKIEDITAASLALCVIKTRETPYEIALYSHGISDKQAEQLHFHKVDSPQEGLEYLTDKIGKNATQLILTHGGETFPLLKNQ